MKQNIYFMLFIVFSSAQELSGFLEYGVSARTQGNPNLNHIDKDILNETRVQIKLEHESDESSLFIKADLIQDHALNTSDVHLREAFFHHAGAEWLDVKIGRQIQTWGVGDLLFINDMFPKDWVSFFSGRNQEYLKKPSDAFRFTIYPESQLLESIDLSVMNHATDKLLQSEQRFSSSNPIYAYYRQNGITFTSPATKEMSVKHTEFSLKIQLQDVYTLSSSLYFHKGYWNTPQSIEISKSQITPYFSRLNVYGGSLQTPIFGGILSFETGYYHSLEDKSGTDPYIENSSLRMLFLYERPLTSSFTVGVQYYFEHIENYEAISKKMIIDKDGLRNSYRDIVSLRLTKKLLNNALTVTWFSFISPGDEDYYLRPHISYEYTDQIRLFITGNIFGAFGKRNKITYGPQGLPNYHNTMFSQFKNDSNINITLRYVW